MKSGVDEVYVSGIGVVSSVGHGVENFWSACLAGHSVVAAVPPHWSNYYRAASKVWSPLAEPDYASHGMTRTDLLTLGKPAAIAQVAALQALSHAGVSRHHRADRYPAALLVGFERSRVGIFVGTGLGAAQSPFNNYYAHVMGGIRDRLRELDGLHPSDAQITERLAALDEHARVNPLVICQTMPNAIAANIAIRTGVQGPVDTTCAACASGTIALGKAFRAVRSGELDLAIAGGVEHLADRAGGVFMGFDRLQTLARPREPTGTENRPFDRDRSGFLFSEGGACFAILESATSLARRGAKAIAQVVGYAETSDAYSVAAIKEECNAIESMIDGALRDARIAPAQIDYINAHGTGTEVNDAVECRIIERKFGRRTKLNSTKSILGHTIGAAGAFEFAVTALSLERQALHLCRNLDNPIADLAFCMASAPASIEYAFTQSFGFGGHNAGLVLRRAQP
jgi:3-oxoacyl-[acyl-carrier-protein] synthase II